MESAAGGEPRGKEASRCRKGRGRVGRGGRARRRGEHRQTTRGKATECWHREEAGSDILKQFPIKWSN